MRKVALVSRGLLSFLGLKVLIGKCETLILGGSDILLDIVGGEIGGDAGGIDGGGRGLGRGNKLLDLTLLHLGDLWKGQGEKGSENEGEEEERSGGVTYLGRGFVTLEFLEVKILDNVYTIRNASKDQRIEKRERKRASE